MKRNNNSSVFLLDIGLVILILVGKVISNGPDNAFRWGQLLVIVLHGRWNTARVPFMNPLTLTYYRALFDESLGFELVHHEQRPIQLGPLFVSDVSGTFSTGGPASLPAFNFTL